MVTLVTPMTRPEETGGTATQAVPPDGVLSPADPYQDFRLPLSPARHIGRPRDRDASPAEIPAARDKKEGRPPRQRGAGRGRARTIARAVAALPATLLVALLLTLALPVAFGCRSLVVMSGSMEPTVPTGSVVVVKSIPGAAIAVGDVISFHPPEDTARIVTHRVLAVTEQDGKVAVETRGDANTGSEKWSIDPAGTVGRVVFHIPYLGYLLAPLRGPGPRLALVVVPAVLLAALLVYDIWHPRRRLGRPERAASRPAGGGTS